MLLAKVRFALLFSTVAFRVAEIRKHYRVCLPSFSHRLLQTAARNKVVFS